MWLPNSRDFSVHQAVSFLILLLLLDIILDLTRYNDSA